ncbi:MAG: hypothetical protein NC388_01325 [Clostridium sp.]|nr:hypothetical protein [Clostridium sp.]
MRKRILTALASFCLLGFSVYGQRADKVIKTKLSDVFQRYVTAVTTPGDRGRIEDIRIDNGRKELHIYMNELFAGQPFTPEKVENLYRDVKQSLPMPYNTYRLTIYGFNTPIEELIPSSLNTNRETRRTWKGLEYKGEPWTNRTSLPYKASHGLHGRHISLWASHGRYFKHALGEWVWQRPTLYCTCEDLFTQTIVVPYLIPMLENAGAIVFTPRERDWQREEVIVDNDTSGRQGRLLQKTGKHEWQTCGPGFAALRNTYQEHENPFREGTALSAHTVTGKNQQSAMTWFPAIRKEGRYAVYVSYASLPTSVPDARYTVRHKGITTNFKVNQQMGGGTWVYLGTFDFAPDDERNNYVMLTNRSDHRGCVTADAVRLGGGMGNIARGDSITAPTVSGLPRFLEGARYSAQWAGMPDSVYSRKDGLSDYADDINTRSFMTNYVAGGSVYLPADSGLRVPIEMSVALHSDAGYRMDHSLVGTLGIYTTNANDGVLASGLSRLSSRDLCDMVMSQVCSDLSSTFGRWNRRQMFDRNYSETRVPGVPSMILEMLSHQNFADMKLGNDPYFRFTLARAVYKAIVRYSAIMHNSRGIIQPLPVTDFAARIHPQKSEVSLSWSAVNDPLEPEAKPAGYVVYTRKDGEDFDNGTYTTDTHLTRELETDALYSFKVAAVNAGGESMPSEVLCALKASNARGNLLIINGFQRTAGPQPFENDSLQGFDLHADPGVAYMCTPEFSGAQLIFNKDKANQPDEQALGFSGNELEGMIVAGNTFDYPVLHGRDIRSAGGYSVSSCSRSAVETATVDLNAYPVIDLILGLQRNDGYSTRNYDLLGDRMCRQLTEYARHGGNLLVSGAYLASGTTETEQHFLTTVTRCIPTGQIPSVEIPSLRGMNVQFELYNSLNETRYAVPSCSNLQPTDGSYCAMLYLNGNQSAATAYAGPDYRCMTLGFPYESITDDSIRRQIMAGILKFLLPK